MGEPVSGTLLQQNASASTEIDDLQLTIEGETRHHQDSSRRHYIYKVPDHFHKSSQQAYTPQVISIGPWHNGNKKLQKMENYKATYWKDFQQRARLTDEKISKIMKEIEEKVPACYEENRPNSDKRFAQIILHDATFIIEYFLRCRFPELQTDKDRAAITRLRAASMRLDFLLLENQLPFFIIEELYKLLLGVDEADQSRLPSFIDLTFDYFQGFNTQNHEKPGPNSDFRINHFVDLLRRFYLPRPNSSFSEKLKRPDNHDPVEGNCLSQLARSKSGNHDPVEEMYCTSQLAEAGMTFKKSESGRCLLELNFENGMLEIPGFILNKDTELCARNLMAWEQLHYPPNEEYITDYFRLLDFLIDTDKDVGLLRRKKILVNRLGDKCATIVNNLCSNNVADTPRTLYYKKLCQDLGHFYNNPWNSWKIKLRRDLSTPWVIVTTISAIFLLVLTLV
ncbi:hypothetical protein I3842_04G148700 [Carya illinoinensis]|uniref:Uncharacterized protein n=1 Tax=Carya illinoinensis TaxID=32201 RepID=A0A922F980_CARIL|nr:hypothetical protein I3842_04G148700 [Carya illinoinensis]